MSSSLTSCDFSDVGILFSWPFEGTILKSPPAKSLRWWLTQMAMDIKHKKVFDPYRSSNEDMGASDFFLTFSMGPRRCVGKSFAMLQFKLVIAMILRHFRLSITPGRPAQPESSLILRSKDGVYLNMENLRP
ncbi:cytochrome P450 4X1-like [Haliotis rufescens]|uniref:cytochrome P450 4X1-like n=1 Tax=Haliotis rufescens TaxID=6454 RepID=UPI00201FB239|nr:cytochrome P450 4X1-like [Haliotis rufescens]